MQNRILLSGIPNIIHESDLQFVQAVPPSRKSINVINIANISRPNSFKHLLDLYCLCLLSNPCENRVLNLELNSKWTPIEIYQLTFRESDSTTPGGRGMETRGLRLITNSIK